MSKIPGDRMNDRLSASRPLFIATRSLLGSGGLTGALATGNLEENSVS